MSNRPACPKRSKCSLPKKTTKQNKFGRRKGNQKQDWRSRRPSSKLMPYLNALWKKSLFSPRQKLRRTNQILLEQSKDRILLQLKAKIQNEDYSEEILQQNIRYRHYLNNIDRIVLKDKIVTRKYNDETGKIKYHQILLPKHLLKEFLQAIHGTAHRHPGISNMLLEIRQK